MCGDFSHKEKTVNTRDRLVRYQQLLKFSDKEARDFLEENRQIDRRFASIVELREQFLNALRESILKAKK
jgi:hypothetical protein